ncbi:MAG: GNAT family N-acetyltransferase [Gemmobacter sp.]
MPATIRPAMPADRPAFLAMWDDFVATDPNEPGNRAMGAANWARIEGGTLHALIADDDGPVGFLLWNAFPFTWSTGDIAYLQDLYVAPAARGQGHAAALIAALAGIGRDRGWYKIFWMTQAHNATAQRLYDRVALRRDHVRYDLPVGQP